MSSEVPIENEPMVPLKFQTNSEGDRFLIYSQSSAIFMEVSESIAPGHYTKIQDATDMRLPLQKKYFMGAVTKDGMLLIDIERGPLQDQDW